MECKSASAGGIYWMEMHSTVKENKMCRSVMDPCRVSFVVSFSFGETNADGDGKTEELSFCIPDSFD